MTLNPGDMSVNPGDTEAPSRQIAAHLRQLIRNGEYQPGERLPSIPAIAQRYGVARQTAQRAIDELRIEGLVLTRPGAGTFVRGSRRRLSRLSRGRYGPVRGYHADLPTRYRVQVLFSGLDTPPEEVSRAFSGQKELFVRRYLILDPDTPVEVGANWLLPADVAGTALAENLPLRRPLYQEIEEHTGRVYADVEDQLSARLATREEATLLRIRADTPVLTLLHIARDTNRRTIEVTQASWPGPATVLTDRYQVPGTRPGTAPPTPGEAAFA